MAKDKDKFINKAQNFIRRGQNDKAIAEYVKALEVDKKDVRLYMKLGDLYSKVNDKNKSIDNYLQAANYLTKDGFYSRAAAVYRQIIQIDDSKIEVIESLADIYNKLGLNNEAMSQYQKLATQFERDGRLKDSLQIVQRMLDLDPRNVVLITKIAELYYKNGMKEQGYQAFRLALDQLQDEGRYEQYLKLLEKLAKADPDNLENLKELAEIYTDHEWDRAYAVLSRIHSKLPEEPDPLTQLADVALKVGRHDESVKLLKKLAGIYKNKGLRQRAKEALRKVLSIKPDDPEALAAVGPSKPLLEEPAHEEINEVIEAEEEEEVVEEGPLEVLEEAEPEEEVLIEAPETEEVAGSTLTPDQVMEHLTEAGVYLKYGLRDKAMSHINIVLKGDPHNIPAHLRLKDIYLETGDTEKAVAELKWASEQALKTGDAETAKSSLQEWIRIDPANAAARQLLVKAEAAAPSPAAAADSGTSVVIAEEIEEVHEISEEPEIMDEAAPQVDEVSAEIAMEEEEELVEEAVEFEDEEAVEEEPAEIEAPEILAAEEVEEETALEAEAEPFEEEAVEVEAVEFEEEEEEEAEEEPALEEEVLEAHETESIQVEEAEEEEEVVSEEVEEPSPPPAPAPAAVAPARNFSEDLSEAEFYIQEGLIEEARKVYLSILREDPTHEIASRKLQEIEANLQTEEAVAEPAEAIAPEPSEPAPAEPILLEPVPADTGLPESTVEELQEPSAPAAAFETAAEPEAEEEAAPPPAPEPAAVAEPAAPEAVSASANEQFDLQAEIRAEAGPGEDKSWYVEPAPPPATDLFDSTGEESGLFDLAAELEKDEDAFPLPASDSDDSMGVDSEFAAFKKGVNQQVSESDSATRYDLGIAYREMGLLDDALQEFLIASRDPKRLMDCMLMSSIIRREKGELDKALEHCTVALASPNAQGQQRSALFMELSQVLIANSEKGKAKWALEQVKSLDPSFPEVDKMIADMGDAAPEPMAFEVKAAPAPAPSPPKVPAPPPPPAMKPPAPAKPAPAAIPKAIPKSAPAPKTVPAQVPKTAPPSIPKAVPTSIPKAIPTTIPKSIPTTVPKSAPASAPKSIPKTAPPPAPPAAAVKPPPAPPEPPLTAGPPPSREQISWENGALEPSPEPEPSDAGANAEAKKKKRKKISYV